MTNSRTLVLRRRHGREKQRRQWTGKPRWPETPAPVVAVDVVAREAEPRASWIVRLLRYLFGWIGGAR